MKKLLSVVLLVGVSFAVCHAVPSHSCSSPTKKEFAPKVESKEFTLEKRFDLQAFDLPVAIEVPAAPAVIYDLVVCEVKQSAKVVTPQANGPPDSI